MDRKIVVLLCGPTLQGKDGAYGDGVGGYTRNMSVYLKYFKSDRFVIVPCFLTIRNNKLPFLLQFPIRLTKDIFLFLFKLIKKGPSLVHILGQYRSATPREFLIVFLARIFNKKVIYEIKAGSFIHFYNSANAINKYMTRYILKKSKLVLSEGEIYLDFVNTLAKRKKSYFFPNFVPGEQVPAFAALKLDSDKLTVLFVGYCYEGKGVFELIRGLNLAASKGHKIELTLIGKEANDFKNWLDNFSLNENLAINRLGVKPHEIVLEKMNSHDIYFYPSKHSGEGHNNSINEAMMSYMVIVTTRIGFLPLVLGDSAYFLDDISDTSIADIIYHISINKKEALDKALNAKLRLMANYTTDTQVPKLESYYNLAITN